MKTIGALIAAGLTYLLTPLLSQWGLPPEAATTIVGGVTTLVVGLVGWLEWTASQRSRYAGALTEIVAVVDMEMGYIPQADGHDNDKLKRALGRFDSFLAGKGIPSIVRSLLLTQAPKWIEGIVKSVRKVLVTPPPPDMLREIPLEVEEPPLR